MTPGVRNVMHMRAAGRAAGGGGAELVGRDAAGRFVAGGANGGTEAMARMKIGLSPEQERWVEKEAVRRRVPKTVVVRELLDRALTGQGRFDPRAVHDVAPDGAVHDVAGLEDGGGTADRTAARTRRAPAIPRPRRAGGRACPRSRWSGRRRTRRAPAPSAYAGTRTAIRTTRTPRRCRGRRACRTSARPGTRSGSGSRGTRRGRRSAIPRRRTARLTRPTSRRAWGVSTPGAARPPAAAGGGLEARLHPRLARAFDRRRCPCSPLRFSKLVRPRLRLLSRLLASGVRGCGCCRDRSRRRSCPPAAGAGGGGRADQSRSGSPSSGSGSVSGIRLVSLVLMSWSMSARWETSGWRLPPTERMSSTIIVRLSSRVPARRR